MILAPKRDELRAFLTSKQVGTAISYPVPFHRQACFASLGTDVNAFPRADAAAETCLALPIYGELTDAQQTEVVTAIADFYAQ